ncbi:BolA family protein [Buchnera aphidicola]|uniref:BolA family transcriptional regulator n=1 Tax=Buchnera aphidicola subsp. Melaphis rhois TaxID=118103 RepID=A0A4D6YBQ0_BUCMH|nr:BolA/IbaG family iron-sulfur metabolism protein [Buchnera aphidicola]QCI23434.1 BolA family transcriptional regulator [Buchnera aphidicola (Melaphis rhois)]
MITKKIKSILTSTFQIEVIKIRNESKLHSKFITNHSHFKIIIVSNDFVKYSLLQRHRKIYHLLSTYISRYKIHGLALYTYTINEWKEKIKTNLISPICTQYTHKINNN